MPVWLVVFPTRVGMNRILSGNVHTLPRVPHASGDEPAN